MAPLDLITHNRLKGQHLRPDQRGFIIGLHSTGLSRAKIASTTGLAWNTINNTLKKAPTRATQEDAPRSGRPKALSPREERILVRLVILHPKWTYKWLLDELPFKTTRDTACRILKTYGYTNWRAKKRQLLTEESAQVRLTWCKNHTDWTIDDWFTVIFTDECSVERGAGKGTRWVWRHTGQAYDIDKVQTRNKTKDIRVMVWGAFSGTKASDLIIMQRDMTVVKQGYTADSYTQALSFGLPSIWQEDKLFQQDNAPIHTAKKNYSLVKRKAASNA